MKKRSIFITIIILLIVTVIIGFVLISNFWKNNDKNIENNIELDKSMWVTPLIKYTINDTEDTFEIMHEVSFPISESGEMLSVIQNISYTVSINGVEYQGSFTFDSDSGISKNEDGNQNYNIELTNYKKNSVFVKITPK